MLNFKRLKNNGYNKSVNSVMWEKSQMSGICLNVLTITPKNPNSANRKIASVSLSNKKVISAYIVGEGNNLETHNIVLVSGGNVQDCIGINHKIVSGNYDMNGVNDSSTSSSNYGVKNVC